MIEQNRARCECGHHPRAHQCAGSQEVGNPAGRYGLRGACGDCTCRRYAGRYSAAARKARREVAGE